MRQRRWLVVWAFLGLAAACAPGDAAEAGPPRIGAPAPAFAAAALAGDTLSLAALRGQVVLLNVWATWCPPCRDEMPALEALHRELAPAGLRVVAVSIDGAGGAGAITDFLREERITFAILHDPAETITRTFRTTGVPETFLIDRDGVLRGRWIGRIFPDSPDVRGPIRAALRAEAAS